MTGDRSRPPENRGQNQPNSRVHAREREVSDSPFEAVTVDELQSLIG